MMKRLVFLFSGLLLYTSQGNAVVTLTGGQFNSSFNTAGQCGEYTNTSSSYDPNCDGWEMQVGLCGPQQRGDSVTTAANYSGGAGGRGYRHWIKCNGSGGAQTGGPLHLVLPSNQPEIWLRFYMSPRAGFDPATVAGWKFLYIFDKNQTIGGTYVHYFWGETRTGSSSCPSLTMDHTYHNNWNITLGNSGGSLSNGCAELDIVGNGAYTAYGIPANGTWHSHEFHLKLDTPCRAGNGMMEYWLDGVKRWSYSNINWGQCSAGGFGNIIIGSNAAEIGCPTCTNDCDYVDFDDIAVSVNGYIGTIGGAQPLMPLYPQQIQVR